MFFCESVMCFGVGLGEIDFLLVDYEWMKTGFWGKRIKETWGGRKGLGML